METNSHPEAAASNVKQGQYSPRKRKDTTPRVNPVSYTHLQEMKPYHIDFPNVKNNCLRFEVSPSIEESATFTDADLSLIHI